MPTAYCRHIRTNGRRCCSPALRTSAFCYYHSNSLQRHRNAAARTHPAPDATPTIIHPLNTDEHRQRNPMLAEYVESPAATAPFTLDFPPLDDRESIQVALSMLVAALGQGRIDGKRAGPMLYALQVASNNVPRLEIAPQANQLVRSTVLDSAGQELAPDEDPQEITEFNRWLAELRASRRAQDNQKGDANA